MSEQSNFELRHASRLENRFTVSNSESVYRMKLATANNLMCLKDRQ